MALRIASVGARAVNPELIDLSALSLPLYQPDVPLSEYPSEVARFLQTIREADAFLWSAPAYHGTISGSMKNALDYLEFLRNDVPPYLTDKAVGLISTAGGMRLIVAFGEAMTKVFVFQIVVGHGPFLGITPVNALKPRRSLKYRHQN